MQSISDQQKITELYFQLLKIPSELLNNSLDLFKRERINHKELKANTDTILLIEATEIIGYKLRNLENYEYYIFYMKQFMNLFNKLLREGYKFKSIIIPEFFKDEEIEDTISQILNKENYTELNKIVIEKAILVERFYVEKYESHFCVYKSGAFFINDKNNLFSEFLEIVKTIL
jgi:hypothetical protein